MAGSNINRVLLTGNLTKDPDLRHTGAGTAVCSLRLAVNGRRKDSSGQWVDKPNYFDVTVWGTQGERVADYMHKGSPVAIDGRLDWQEWDDKETGRKRQKVGVVADSVQFLPSRDGQQQQDRGDVPGDTADFTPASAAQDDSDIPF